MTVTGGCLCGEVRYRAQGEPLWVVHCHCRWCQRVSGAAFLTCISFRTVDFEWVEETKNAVNWTRVRRTFARPLDGRSRLTRPQFSQQRG